MKKTIFGLTIFLAITLLAGTAFSHGSRRGMMGNYDEDSYGMMGGRGMMGGHGMMENYNGDNGYGFCGRYSDVDRAEVTAITDKYADQFDALQQKMETKRDEMHKARTNDATTVGQLKAMRDEMFSINKEYRALSRKVDAELSDKFGDEDTYGYGMRGGRGHRGGMMDGRGYGGCR